MIEKIKYNLIRKYYANNLTGHMGNIEIKDDKIICHVKKSSIHKERNEFMYYLGLRGTIFYSEELKNKYNLNKPIYYIFDSITFNKELHLHAGVDTHVIFRNCTFNDAIEIIWCAEEITFENNNYNNIKPYSFSKKIFLNCKAKKINFIGDIFMDISSKKEERQITFGINAEADELKIQDSFICVSDDLGKIRIRAKHTEIKDSIIDATNIEIKSDTINMENSRITANNEIIIDNELNNNLENIDAKEILYNGILIRSSNNEIIDIDETTREKITKRNELINLLTNIRNLINEINSNKLAQVKNSLEAKNIDKILKIK